jgi:site-specific DNA recombinase
MKDNNKIGLFFRVSSEQQVTKGSGLENQKKMGRELAKKLGFEIEEFDEGVQSTHTTTIDEREVVLRLLRRIEDKKSPLRRVWVYNTDRFGRNSLESSKIIQTFHIYDVKVYQGDSTSPKDLSSFTDKFMMDIFSVIASYDNSLRRMRANDGKRNSLLRGNTYVGGTVPFGFKVIDKNIVFHEEESKIVLELFEKYSKNESTIELKKWLDGNPNIKPRRSVTWSLGTIQKMLKNKVYNGTQKWQWKNKLPNGEVKLMGEPIYIKVSKIVDDETFNIVQRRISEITYIKVRNTTNKKKSLLSGLLKCDKCKLQLSNRYRENIGMGNHYYGRCTEHQWRTNDKKIPKSECLVQKSLRIEETDELILNTLIDLIKKSSTIREEYRIRLLSQKEKDKDISIEKSSKIRKKIKVLDNSIDSLENKVAVTEVQKVTKEISKSIGNRIISISNDEIHKKIEELEDLERKLSILKDSSKFIDWLDNMSMDVNSIKTKPKDYQRNWIRQFIRSVTVEYNDEVKSHNLEINFHIGLVNDTYEREGVSQKGDLMYKIIEGKRNMKLTHKWVKRTELVDENYLKNTIIQIKKLQNKGYSNIQICENLNENKIKTVRKRLWNKGSLIKFRNKYITPETVPK